MSISKALLAVVAVTLLTLGGIHLIKQHEGSLPIDINGQKIRLGGIPWNYINCGTENDPLVITSVVFSGNPERAAPPNDASLTGTFMIHAEIKTMNVVVQLSGVQVFNNNIPASGTYDPGDMFNFPYAFQIPGIAPGGPYTVDLRFISKANQVLSCTRLPMDL